MFIHFHVDSSRLGPLGIICDISSEEATSSMILRVLGSYSGGVPCAGLAKGLWPVEGRLGVPGSSVGLFYRGNETPRGPLSVGVRAPACISPAAWQPAW